jgi:hypothetical protein
MDMDLTLHCLADDHGSALHCFDADRRDGCLLATFADESPFIKDLNNNCDGKPDLFIGECWTPPPTALTVPCFEGVHISFTGSDDGSNDISYESVSDDDSVTGGVVSCGNVSSCGGNDMSGDNDSVVGGDNDSVDGGDSTIESDCEINVEGCEDGVDDSDDDSDDDMSGDNDSVDGGDSTIESDCEINVEGYEDGDDDSDDDEVEVIHVGGVQNNDDNSDSDVEVIKVNIPFGGVQNDEDDDDDDDPDFVPSVQLVNLGRSNLPVRTSGRKRGRMCRSCRKKVTGDMVEDFQTRPHSLVCMNCFDRGGKKKQKA